ncbi:MAG: histidine kinase [Bacteroidota bacterium]
MASFQESMLVIVSILATAACFNIALFFGYGKAKSYLFFAFYCVFHCFKIYLKTFPDDAILVANLNAYQLVYLSVVLGMFSLSTFFALYFKLPFIRSFLLGYVGAAALFLLFIPELGFIQFSLGVAVAQVVLAAVQGQKATIMLFGILGFAFCVWLGWNNLLNFGYFAGVIVMIFAMVLATSMELARKNNLYHQMQLRATRLENQLLKSTIQPHFILNSLTSLQELIAMDSKKASEFVQELSTVFDLFAKISDQKFIPIHQEIALVQAYLDIMGLRKSVAFELSVQDMPQEDLIPPGILLTLVENGVTHGYENREKGVFRITKEHLDTGEMYAVGNDGNPTMAEVQNGTGLNYVMARLKESYGDKFTFESLPQTSGWLSKITIWA